MTLNEKKFNNYSTLSELLFKLETIIRDWYEVELEDVEKFSKLMKTPMYYHDIREINDLFDNFILFHNVMAEKTENGYSITMIAPEAKNEEDPIKDVLRLNKVEDVFWARDIVNKALLGLFPKEV